MGVANGSYDGHISVQSVLELLQCAKDRKQHLAAKQFLSDLGFIVLPFTENIGHRALVYVEEYGLSSGLRAGDATSSRKPPAAVG